MAPHLTTARRIATSTRDSSDTCRSRRDRSAWPRARGSCPRQPRPSCRRSPGTSSSSPTYGTINGGPAMVRHGEESVMLVVDQRLERVGSPCSAPQRARRRAPAGVHTLLGIPVFRPRAPAGITQRVDHLLTRSSRTPSSHEARGRRFCIPSGSASLAYSAIGNSSCAADRPATRTRTREFGADSTCGEPDGHPRPQPIHLGLPIGGLYAVTRGHLVIF